MAIIINSIKNHPRLFALSILLLVAVCILIGLLMHDDEMDVQQFSFATKEGVQYTITMNQDPDSQSGRLNVRLLTLDTRSAPLIFMKSVPLSSGGQYFDCDMSLKIPSCANNEQPTNGVVYLKAYPVHQIY
jgi:hypothetical protein